MIKKSIDKYLHLSLPSFSLLWTMSMRVYLLTLLGRIGHKFNIRAVDER